MQNSTEDRQPWRDGASFDKDSKRLHGSMVVSRIAVRHHARRRYSAGAI